MNLNLNITDVEIQLERAPDRVTWAASFQFPYRTKSVQNVSANRWAKAQRVKEERIALFYAWVMAGKPKPPAGLKISVKFVRIAPRRLDEGDNLPSAFKPMRDELAKLLGLRGDTQKDGVTWSYDQERGAPKEYQVRVEMRAEGIRRG